MVAVAVSSAARDYRHCLHDELFDATLMITERSRDKRCPKCKIDCPRETWTRNPNGYVRPYCDSCTRRQRVEWRKDNPERTKEYNSAYYQAHRKEHRKTAIKRRKENREKIREYLLSHPCVDCGETNPVVLEFDHVRGVKRNEVSRFDACSWRIIEAEIYKCDVRCANCHRLATYNRRLAIKEVRN